MLFVVATTDSLIKTKMKNFRVRTVLAVSASIWRNTLMSVRRYAYHRKPVLFLQKLAQEGKEVAQVCQKAFSNEGDAQAVCGCLGKLSDKQLDENFDCMFSFGHITPVKEFGRRCKNMCPADTTSKIIQSIVASGDKAAMPICGAVKDSNDRKQICPCVGRAKKEVIDKLGDCYVSPENGQKLKDIWAACRHDFFEKPKNYRCCESDTTACKKCKKVEAKEEKKAKKKAEKFKKLCNKLKKLKTGKILKKNGCFCKNGKKKKVICEEGKKPRCECVEDESFECKKAGRRVCKAADRCKYDSGKKECKDAN